MRRVGGGEGGLDLPVGTGVGKCQEIPKHRPPPAGRWSSPLAPGSRSAAGVASAEEEALDPQLNAAKCIIFTFLKMYFFLAGRKANKCVLKNFDKNMQLCSRIYCLDFRDLSYLNLFRLVFILLQSRRELSDGL